MYIQCVNTCTCYVHYARAHTQLTCASTSFIYVAFVADQRDTTVMYRQRKLVASQDDYL